MKTLKKILKSCFAPLSLLNKLIPKASNRVFFYSNLGFRDNVRALYDYMIENGFNRKFKITVATNEFKSFIDSAPENVKFVGLKRGIFSFLGSKYCFYSFGKYPIKPAKEQCVVNLWHGMPLKGIGRLEKGCEEEDQNFFTYVIATSPFFADVMCKAFGAGENQALITPQPRCDVFLKEIACPEFFSGFKKVVLWLPTFMSSKRLNKTDGCYEEINPFDEAFLEKLCGVLQKENILLFIKPHPMDDTPLPSRAYKNIRFASESELCSKSVTLHQLLKHSDALITDFSSIYFDYLLLNKPIAFAGPDSEKYGKNRGYAFDNIENLMPGSQIKTAEEFSDFLSSVVKGEDTTSEKRRQCNEICNQYKDISGCKLILEKIGLKSEE